MRRVILTDPQRRALEHIRSFGGSIRYEDFYTNDAGRKRVIRSGTIAALWDRGLVDWLRPKEDGDPWFAITDAGREALDRAS